MSSQRQAWDEHYSRPDPLWKGLPTALNDIPAGRVLELGCGNGKTAQALVRLTPQVVGLDFSRSGLLACRAAVPSPNLNLVEGDLRSLPFADRSFDHVVAIHVLGHLLQKDRGTAMHEISRVLVPGGGLSLRAFSRKDMRSGQGREVEPGTFVRGNGIPTHFFVRQELEALTMDLVPLSLEERIIEKRYHGLLHHRAEWEGSFQLADSER